MTDKQLQTIYAPSEDVVAREIEGELIIIPLAAGIGDLGDELYTLNETGKVIWAHLDGHKNLAEIVTALSAEYDAPAGEIEQDVFGLVQELLSRRILVEVPAVH